MLRKPSLSTTPSSTNFRRMTTLSCSPRPPNLARFPRLLLPPSSTSSHFLKWTPSRSSTPSPRLRLLNPPSTSSLLLLQLTKVLKLLTSSPLHPLLPPPKRFSTSCSSCRSRNLGGSTRWSSGLYHGRVLNLALMVALGLAWVGVPEAEVSFFHFLSF